MPRRPTLALVAAALAAAAPGSLPAQAPGVVPPAVDFAPELAALLAQAIADGSNAALIEFIARYPDEPPTDRARQALRARRQPDAVPAPGPDGAVVAAFDTARLAGPAGLAAFAAAYANHPLGAEARRAVWSR